MINHFGGPAIPGRFTESMVAGSRVDRYSLESVRKLSLSFRCCSPSHRQEGPFRIPGSNLRFAVDWTTNSHTGSDTPLTAAGPGSERLGRVLDNTEVFAAMRAAARL